MQPSLRVAVRPFPAHREVEPRDLGKVLDHRPRDWQGESDERTCSTGRAERTAGGSSLVCLPLKTEEELQTILSEGSTPRREWRACRNCGRQIYSYHSICGECRRQRRPDEGGE